MKKLLFTLFVYAIVVLISSCGGSKTQDDHSGAHTHEDGTVHDGDHSQEEQTAVEQESFNVDADSTEAHDHDHSGTHTHDDGTVHEGATHDSDTAHEEDGDHDHDHQH
jgi:hypothetical protein